MQIIVSAKHAITAIFEDIKMGFWSNLFGFKPDEAQVVSSTTPIDASRDTDFNVKSPSPSELLKMVEKFEYFFHRFTNKTEYTFNSAMYEIDAGIAPEIFTRKNAAKKITISCPTFKHTIMLLPSNTMLIDGNDSPDLIKSVLNTIELEIKAGVIKVEPTPFGKVIEFSTYPEFIKPGIYVSKNIAIEIESESSINFEQINVYRLYKDETYNEMVVGKAFNGDDVGRSYDGIPYYFESNESMFKLAEDFLRAIEGGAPKLSEWTKIDSLESYWVNEMLATKSIERAKRHKNLIKHMEKVMDLHIKFNVAAHKYGHLPAAPIKCYASYVAFMKEIKLIKDTGLPYTDYEVENYLRSINKYEKN